MRGATLFGGIVSLFVVSGLIGCGGSSAYISQVNAKAPAGTGFVDKQLRTSDGDKKYVVFTPFNYSPTKRMPLLVFLNGYGESGRDNLKHLSVGLGPALKDRASDFPFVVLFVQTPGKWSANGEETRTLLAAMDRTISEYNLDPTRVVLTGMSTGGEGVWRVGAAHQQRFAALVPVCGWSASDTVDQLTNIPIWAFHCSGDPLIFSGNTSSMVSAINKKGGKAKYTSYGALAHDAWTRTYSDPDVYAWMLQQRKPQAAVMK